jgi:hypothetical protein
MPDVPKHAWTHRPKSEGGTDPITSDLPYIVAHNSSISQTVTTTTELIFQAAVTNDTSTFDIDVVDDPSGILIYKPGLFLSIAEVNVGSGDIAVARAIYQHWNVLSFGVSFGDEIRPGIGTGQNASGIPEVTSGGISKSKLSHLALAALHDVDPTDPYRLGCVLQRQFANWTVQNLASSVTVVRLSGTPSFIDFSP